MPKRKPPVQPGTMRVRAYPVLAEAVDAGVAHGWRRAYKYREDEPGAEVAEFVRADIASSVLGEICEWFDFPEDSDA